jgi:DNA-nicking Smr family endonuclease
MTLDLHDIKHVDVPRQVDAFIWTCMQDKLPQASIVTGNSEDMKNIVIKCLTEHGMVVNPFIESNSRITFDL